MIRRRFFLGILLSLAVLAVQVMGQDGGSSKKTPGSPEDAFLKAMQAVKDDRIEEFAQAIDPDDLKHFQGLLASLVEIAKKQGEEQQVLRLFSGVKTGDELKALAPIPFFTAYYAGVMSAVPGTKEVLARSKNTVLGRVDEGTDTAYLIYRMSFDAQDEEPELVKAVCLRRTKGRWMMRLDGDLERAVLILKREVEDKKPGPPKFQELSVETLGRINDQDGAAFIPYRVTIPVGDSQYSKLAVLSVKKTARGYPLVKDGKSPELAAAIREMLMRQLSAPGPEAGNSTKKP
jgi:hypothetical protein